MQAVQTTNAAASKKGNPIDTALPITKAENNAVATAPPPNDMTTGILNHLLWMADNYRAGGSLWQAEEMYRTLLADHADTPQAEQARTRLIELCEAYELAGQLHHARSLYERLL